MEAQGKTTIGIIGKNCFDINYSQKKNNGFFGTEYIGEQNKPNKTFHIVRTHLHKKEYINKWLDLSRSSGPTAGYIF